MADDIKISVVVPVYNVKEFIPGAIKSLKDQTFRNLEVIIVDDGTPDDTYDLICREIRSDPRFRCIRIPHSGYGKACNTGMENASGNYVAIYEPDDLLAPDFYECLAEYAKSYPEVDVFRYNGFFKTNGTDRIHRYECYPKFTERVMDKYGTFRIWRFHPSVFNGIYKTSFIRRHHIVMCETEGASYQDVPFMVSLFYAEPQVFLINQAKYFYVSHQNQSVKRPEDKLNAIFLNWEHELKWVKEQGYRDIGFCNYKMLMQLHFMTSRVRDPGEADRIYRYVCDKLDSIFFPLPEVAPLRHKFVCRALYLSALFRRITGFCFR